jgi:hypothetical protein
MSLATIHNNGLTFAGVGYFRGNAPSIRLADYGQKRSPAFSANYLEPQDGIPAAKLKINQVTEVGIDFEKSSEADIKLNLNVAGLYKGGADAAYGALKSGTLKLIKLDMDLGDVKDAVNNSPAVLNNLASYGGDARVAHQVFLVLSSTEADSFKVGGTVSVSKLGTSLVLTAGTNGSTKVELSSGTTYAYLLCKPDWNTGKTKVDIFTGDTWSI